MTQTKCKLKKTYYKLIAEKVLAHQEGGVRMGVSFRVKWSGYRIETTERSVAILGTIDGV